MPACKIPFAASLAALAAMAALAPSAHAADAADAGHATGRILAVARAGLGDAHVAAQLRADHARARRVGRSNLLVIEVPAGSEQAMVDKLRRHPHYKSAELDRRLPPSLVANDPYLGAAWHLPVIQAPAAWDLSQGAGVTIAILDTGVDASHPDLAPRLVPGWNFHDNTADTTDVHGHGTSVAGSAAAATDNGLGVAGVAGQARIMPIRISDASGNGYWSLVAQGLVHAADRNVRVANVSYMVSGSSTVQNASQYMKSKGGLVFAAAGNSGVELATAPTTTLVTVGATDGADLRASWSSFGPVVSLAAPGAGIYTTRRGGGYGAVSGTSFASPVAAGVAALLFSARPGLSAAQAEGLLFSTAADLGASGRDAEYGHGRVDAAAAVRAALALAVPAADTTPPQVAIGSPAGGGTVSGLVNVDVSASDNVGVVRVDLRANGVLVASDAAQPFGFTWDSTGVADGSATLVAQAFDAAGNQAAAAPVMVNVANAAAVSSPDVTPPAVRFVAPTSATVKGNVTVSTSATDDAGAAALTQTLFIDGRRVAAVRGGSLSYAWNTNKVAAGAHVLRVDAVDASGNAASTSLTVRR
ncbi:S8 family serine peptidase [Aquincola sp. J276]|uniref:S8 family serine peptidase n=1 Tax=Aquincola sp. J276 TaxID=2898432 RepID=UPI002150A3FD|nr:S8 family serine peptidase [Aquincola sp. J276]MCR5867280.1 S8 family serine peptidase [Aquincola sp. J276]